MSSSQLSPDSAQKNSNIDSELSKLKITENNTSNDAKDSTLPGTAKTYRWADEMDDTDSSLDDFTQKESEDVERSHNTHIVRISNLIKNTTATQIKEVLPRELIIHHITFETDDHTSALVSFKQDIHMLKALQHSGKIIPPNYSSTKHSGKDIYLFIDPWEDPDKKPSVKNNLKHSSSSQSLPRSKTTSNYSPLTKFHTDDFSRHGRGDRNEFSRLDRSERSDFSRSDHSRSEALSGSDRGNRRQDFRTNRNNSKANLEEPKPTSTERPKLILKARTKPLNTEFTSTLAKINEAPLPPPPPPPPKPVKEKEPSEPSRPTSPLTSSKKSTQRGQDSFNTPRTSKDLSKASLDKEHHISRQDSGEKSERKERTGRRDRPARQHSRTERSNRSERSENTVSTATQTDADITTRPPQPPQKDKSGSFSKTSSPRSNHPGNKYNSPSSNNTSNNKYTRKKSDGSFNKSHGNRDNRSTGKNYKPPS